MRRSEIDHSEIAAGMKMGGGRRIALACTIVVITLISTMLIVSPTTVSADVTVPSWPFMSVDGRLSAVDVVWDPPTSDGGSPVTAYNLYRGTTSTQLSLYQSFGPTVFSFTDTGVVNGIEYYYALGAENAVGEGQRAGPTLAIAGDDPGPPREFSGYAAGDLIFMTWQPPEYYGGCDITSYKVYTGQSGEWGTVYSIEDTGANVTSYSFDWTDHFSAGFTAFFKLMAYNGFGSGPFSNGIFITMPTEATTPGSPKNVNAISSGLNVTLTWDPPDSDGGSPITGYEIMRGTSPNSSSLLVELGAVMQYIDESVQAGQTYYYSVRTLNSIGTSPVTVEVSVEVVAIVPSAPTSLVVTPGNGRAILSWSAPSSNGGSELLGYRVYRGSNESSLTLLTTLGNVLTFTDTSVVNGDSYYYVVAAFNDIGESLASSGASVTPDEAAGGGGDITLLVALGLVVAAVVAAGAFLMLRKRR